MGEMVFCALWLRGGTQLRKAVWEVRPKHLYFKTPPRGCHLQVQLGTLDCPILYDLLFIN